MSRSKFMVIKLSDLKLPLIMLAIAIAVFSYFMLSSNDATQTFAPDNSYEDGMYIANVAFSDASMDVVVSVLDEEITSIALDGFDATEQMLYQDLQNSLTFVNDYITSTQSLEFPEGSTSMNASTSILMDAVKVALSDDQNAMITSTYQAPLLEQLTEDTLLEETAPVEEGTAQVEDTTPEEVAVEDTMVTDEANASTTPAPSTEEEKKDN